MATYLEDLVQNIYTNCDMKGLNDLNSGLQQAVGYTKELDSRLRSAQQAQKQGFDFHARAINASKEAYQVESQRLKLVDLDTRLRMRRADLEDKYAHNAKRRDEAEIARLQKRNGLIRYGMRLLGAYVSIRTLQNIVQTGSRLQLVQKSIEGLTKSTQDWEFLNQQAYKFGLSLNTVASGYKNFYSSASMAGFGKGQIQSMFGDILLGARSIGASDQQIGGALLALEQMMSKGRVSMEELRRQLGNALPGAFEIGAKAMGVTTAKFNEMVEAGISANEFVPKFIKTFKEQYQNGWKDVEQTASVALGRLGYAWEKFTIDFLHGESGKNFAKAINSLVDLFVSPEFKRFVQILGEIFKWTMKIFQIVMKLVNFLKDNLPFLLTLLGVAGLYGLMRKFPIILRIMNMEALRGVGLMTLLGANGVKSFFAMNAAALKFGATMLGILSWILIIQDVLLYLIGLATGEEIDTITGRMVGQIPNALDNLKAMVVDLPKETIKRPDKNASQKEWDLYYDYIIRRNKGIKLPPNILTPFFDGAIGFSSPISGTYEPYTPPDIIPSGLPMGGASAYSGMLNKEQEVTTSVNIGDINVYSNASNPQQVAQEVQEQLIALFMGQGLITDVEGYA